jgi:4-diphosphocytidyl-2-C-methyl-D-erythritol kinase
VRTLLSAFSLEAHAKLNLRLEVGPLAGSLHQVLSVVAELELADELHFNPSPSGFQVVCEHTNLAERDNLAWRAAQALGRDLPHVRIVIEKNIPMQAGLGGGSADAAGALLGLALIFSGDSAPISHQQLTDAALRTGSDVPSFLTSGLRIISGVGESVVRRAAQIPQWGIALLQPVLGSSTAHAYALLDEAGVPHDLGNDALASANEMCDAYAGTDFDRFVRLLHNDFTAVIERSLPAVAQARERLERVGARTTLLCGSGSCVAGFFETRTAAHDALAKISVEAGEWAYATGFSSD